MSEIEIEKGIAIPAYGIRGSHRAKYPFRQMEVGDSFTVMDTTVSFQVLMNRLCGASRNCKNKKFTTRKIGDHEVRVWRLK